MKLAIVHYGDPVLRQKGKPVGPLTPEIEQLINDMLETMRDAQGIGLAAQQIGRALQLAIIDVTGMEKRPSKMWINDQPVDPEAHMPLLLIDPVLTLVKKKYVEAEGCLSFPDVYGDISRSTRVRVETRTRDGQPFVFEAGGLLGRAIQHEYDHLQGVLFIDRMDPEKRAELREQLQAIQNKTHQPEPEDGEE
jgi:peptide deformylase